MGDIEEGHWHGRKIPDGRGQGSGGREQDGDLLIRS